MERKEKRREAVKVENLKKSYGDRQVLKGVSFQVSRGEIFGVLGVNGAGKTTLLECLEGFRRYEEGKVWIGGTCGVQLQNAALPAYIRPEEAMKLFSGWKGTKKDRQSRPTLELEDIRGKRYGQLSTGQKRRLQLALALIGSPEILFLDEPAAGLDVEARQKLHRAILELKKEGTAIILTSHDMGEVEQLCDRIAILREGSLIFQGTAKELAARTDGRCRVKIVTKEGEEVRFMREIGEELLAALEEYKRKGIKIQDIQVDRGTLEEHFLSLAGEVSP